MSPKEGKGERAKFPSNPLDNSQIKWVARLFPELVLLWAGDFYKLWHVGNFNQGQGLVRGDVYKCEWRRKSRFCP